MFKRNKLTTALAASVMISLSAVVGAQESVTSTATVTVSNAFDFTEVAALNFGTLRASQNLQIDGGSGAETVTTPAYYTVKADGTANTVSASTLSGGGANALSAISELTAGTPAEYLVAAAAPFTALTLQNPANATLVRPGGDTNEDFLVEIEFADMRVQGGANDGDVIDNAGAGLFTDATGSVSLIVGGRISMNTVAAQIRDGNYSGSYTIQVDY